jgi:RNA polymerase sigma factor (TIGR02999 family)
MSSPGEVTGLLVAWRDGDTAAHDRLMELVYGELKQLARAYVRRELPGQSLTPTALVHEAYIKLVDQRVLWQSRSHFFGIAAQAMRRILVDRARGRQAAKRGGLDRPLEPHDEAFVQPPPAVDVLALDEALTRLAMFEPRWSRLVELRYFAGLTVEDTAAVLDLSTATVERDWRLARTWLYRELRGPGET